MGLQDIVSSKMLEVVPLNGLIYLLQRPLFHHILQRHEQTSLSSGIDFPAMFEDTEGYPIFCNWGVQSYY